MVCGLQEKNDNVELTLTRNEEHNQKHLKLVFEERLVMDSLGSMTLGFGCRFCREYIYTMEEMLSK